MRSGLCGFLLAAGWLAGLFAGPASADAYRLLRIDGVLVKWGVPRLGAPGDEITWGFATAGREFPDAINCRSMVSAERLGHHPDRLAEIASAAFGMWSHAADLRFRPAAAGEEPDILIGAQAEPERVAFANVRHAAGSGIAPLTQATICFNPEIAWSGGPAKGAPDFRTVLAHEIGHAIGLDHPGAGGALMGFRDQGEIDQLMPGDIAGAVALYGPARNEPQ